MKKRFASVVLVMAIIFCSVIPGLAASRLSRPVIEDVDPAKQSIKVDWTSVKHADEYNIYRATSSDGTYKYLTTSDVSWYRDYDIKKGTRYYYKIRAVSYGDYNDSYLSKWRSGKVKKPVSKSSNNSTSISQTVYITNTGSKYHRAGCGYLWNSSSPISLNSAKNSGYTACSRCW